MFRQVLIIVAATAALILGCGKEKMWVGPTGPEPGQLTTRAAKPAMMSHQDVSGKKRAVVQMTVLDGDGNPIPDGHYIVLYPSISGLYKASGPGSEVVSGRATVEVFNFNPAGRGYGDDLRDVHGYYYARVHHIATGTFLKGAEWHSIPINGGQTINLVLQIGRQALSIRESRELDSYIKIILDASTPSAQKLKMGTVNQLVTVLKVVNADKEGRDIPLNGLGLRLDGDIPLKGVIKATVWDGVVKIGEYVFPYGRYSMGWFYQPLWVAGSSSKSLAVKIDLAPVSSATVPDFNNKTLAVNYDSGNPDNTWGADPVSGQIFYADGDDYMHAPKHTVIAE